MRRAGLRASDHPLLGPTATFEISGSGRLLYAGGIYDRRAVPRGRGAGSGVTFRLARLCVRVHGVGPAWAGVDPPRGAGVAGQLDPSGVPRAPPVAGRRGARVTGGVHADFRAWCHRAAAVSRDIEICPVPLGSLRPRTCCGTVHRAVALNDVLGRSKRHVTWPSAPTTPGRCRLAGPPPCAQRAEDPARTWAAARSGAHLPRRVLGVASWRRTAAPDWALGPDGARAACATVRGWIPSLRPMRIPRTATSRCPRPCGQRRS